MFHQYQLANIQFHQMSVICWETSEHQMDKSQATARTKLTLFSWAKIIIIDVVNFPMPAALLPSLSMLK